jgi:hypothetical protein
MGKIKLIHIVTIHTQSTAAIATATVDATTTAIATNTAAVTTTAVLVITAQPLRQQYYSYRNLGLTGCRYDCIYY